MENFGKLILENCGPFPKPKPQGMPFLLGIFELAPESKPASDKLTLNSNVDLILQERTEGNWEIFPLDGFVACGLLTPTSSKGFH